MMRFWMCFVPLFVAVDAIGSVPLFLACTHGMHWKEFFKIIIESVITATVVALTFLFGGRELMRLLGIDMSDFMVAGGIIIFIIAITNVLSSEKLHKMMLEGGLGAVPLGVPLITGPAVLATSLLLVDTYGAFTTAAALVLNILIAGLLFFFSAQLNRILGSAGATILSKIANLLMASIGIMMIRRGIMILIKEITQSV
ncbi:MAG TPA: MarC family protein [Deltaproteobacteria bacterium]|jgi:multiple antibiotic resistance protein|nr:MarC family protein [Deltaproteobacteria bacterium]